jgi:hypothetical protein
VPTNQLKLLRADPLTRTEVFCDKEDHVTIVKPANPNDGYPNHVTSGPCTCTEDHPQTPHAFEALGTPTVEPKTALCGAAKSFNGLIKYCTLEPHTAGLHEAGAQKWP